jgi:hypothetical protein
VVRVTAAVQAVVVALSGFDEVYTSRTAPW